MRFTPLIESGLEISGEDIAAVFRPFVSRFVNNGDPEWCAEIQRRKRKILRKYLAQLFLGWMPAKQRRESTVSEEYSKAWQADEYAKYSLTVPPPRLKPWEWRGRHMFASDIGAVRFRQLLLSRVVEQVKPRSVLEVGCGNGINLLLLACRYPEIEFTGIELTQQGHQAAVKLQKLATLPQPMQDYAPLPLVDPTAFRRIRFLQGNAICLPFGDRSIDLVFTVLAVEQMERVRHQALQEIARVVRRHILMIEPFRDVNDSGWPRRNVIRRNYFRGRIANLSGYGFRPLLAIRDFPQEVFLKVCAVLAEREAG